MDVVTAFFQDENANVIWKFTHSTIPVGFDHSIVGNVEVFSGLLVSEDIKITKYLSFLATAIIGNAIGKVVHFLKNKAFAHNGND